MNTRTTPPGFEDMDIHAQVRTLRDQVEKVIAERAAPYLADAIDRAEHVAKRGYDAARENVDAVSDRVKQQPLTSIAIAALAGFVLARIMR